MKMPLLKKLQIENQRLKEDINNITPSITGKGENVTLNGTANARFKKFNISGNSKQETRESYNLLDFRKAKGGTNIGVTATINPEGSFTLHGTATDKTCNIWLLGDYNNMTPLFTLPAGTYQIMNCLIFHRQTAEGAIGGSGSSTIGGSEIVTFKEQFQVTAVRVPNVEQGTTYDDKNVYYAMIAKTDTELPWIQYGDMPSLDYPSEIKSCGDNGNINFKISDGKTQEQNITIPVQKPFRAMEEYKDKFINKNGRWYEQHLIYRYIFTGDENWYRTPTRDNNAFYFFTRLENDFRCKDMNKIQSNIGLSPTAPFDKGEGIQFYFTSDLQQINIYLEKTKNMTETEFKAELKKLKDNETPIYVDYILEKPKEIECIEGQNTILDEIQREARTYKNITNIASSDEISPVFEVEAFADIQN